MNDKQPVSTSAPHEQSSKLTRRDFVQIGTIAAGGAAVAAVGITMSKLSGTPGADDPTGPGTIRSMPEMATVPKGEGSDPLVRMQEELRRALAKPVEQRRWIMVIDTRKCVGCHACTVACIAENKLPPGVVYRPVLETEIGTFPNVALRFTPRPCMQCDNPPCVPVCPVKATWKRPDGITTIDYDKCIGCGYCITACPYNARTRDLGENYTDNTPAIQPYEEAPNYEYGKSWSRTEHKSPVGNARKCQFCVHRLDQGLLPQCVTTCIGRANYFGDANDPDALVNKKAASPNAMRLLEEKGTKPSVVYLI
jgi:molybdopterin-containing oxidoreductase family iron-sulfur binding subunit